jgi:glucose/arabinose dehydrogenase
LLTLASQGALALPPVELTVVASGFSAPTGLASAEDGTNRLFVVEQRGVVWIWDGAQVLAAPFLDIQAQVSFGGERGLFSIAVHPDFPQTAAVYVSYTRLDGASVVSRFALDALDPNQLEAASESVLLVIPQPFPNHNGGDLHFGPDGYLYISLGDGGSGGDPGERGQSLSTLLGKILRVDVDAGTPYAIPSSNPFANDANGLDEIWAYGLRNPWKFSFDRSTGDLFIGDVGQLEREEIDFQPAASGGGENYGWRRFEGDLCFDGAAGCDPSGLVSPILVYARAQGATCEAVTGGFRHRGSRSPTLNGWYFFGEGCPRGRLFAASEDAPGSWTFEVVTEIGGRISAFGEDEDGELYLADLSRGELLRVPEPAAGAMASAGLLAILALGARRSRASRLTRR